jgi:hypothetical protein
LQGFFQQFIARDRHIDFFGWRDLFRLHGEGILKGVLYLGFV